MDDNHLIYRIIKYGKKNQFFTYSELNKELNLSLLEKDFVLNTLIGNTIGVADNPNHLMVIVQGRENEFGFLVKETSTLCITPNAIFQYNDYLEIQEARRHADEAKKQSTLALQITVYSIMIAVVIGLGQLILQVIEMVFSDTK